MEDNRTLPPSDMTEEQLSELLQIRRDKLAALRSAGCDPFAEITYQQTHHIGELHGYLGDR